MVSAAINGDLGVWIKGKVGRKKKPEEDKFYLKGTVSLWHNDQIIASESFNSPSLRKKIIKKWWGRYQLTDKSCVYIQIAYNYF